MLFPQVVNQITSQVSLKALNTFAIDALAEHFLIIDHTANFEVLLPQIQSFEERLILGGGSNVLFVSDFSGLIIFPQFFGVEIISQTDVSVEIAVGASENWHRLVEMTVQNDWFGLENLALIPGTVGAAPVQNIGAYGVEVKQVITSVEGIDLESGLPMRMETIDCNFGYRDSLFKQHPGRYLISKVCLRLSKQPNLCLSYPPLKNHFQGQVNIQPLEVMQKVCQIRSAKLPDPGQLANAGSFFKNPIVSLQCYAQLLEQFDDIVAYPVEGGMKLAAGWLIEKAGLKGVRSGNVGVHAHQALVIVNYAADNGFEVWRMAEMIKQKVEQIFGVKLEPEVSIIGEVSNL
ncbi:UDP-N-acetylmuramate dehydrogenase [Aliikangiella maris]|uniref:UDP-N-acetylmuramate dehydrogenase n=2 Tax=Aliikangiella maris TaxID=3162458 RepID=A0ABV2BZC2_9GAMM